MLAIDLREGPFPTHQGQAYAAVSISDAPALIWPSTQIEGQRYGGAALPLGVLPEVQAVSRVEPTLVPATTFLIEDIGETVRMQDMRWRESEQDPSVERASLQTVDCDFRVQCALPR